MYNICMDKIKFVWDEEKNIINQEKQLRLKKTDMIGKGEKAYENC